MSGAKDILQRARTLVKDYRIVNPPSSQQRNTDPPPPYSPNPYYSNSPYNPYYSSPGETSDTTPVRNEGPSGLYPSVRNEEELASALNSVKFS